MQGGDVKYKEHSSIGIETKKVLLHGWDADNLTTIKLLVDSSGKLKTFTSIEDATIYVMKHYEQPADQSPAKQAERIGYAKQVF